jgi:hypothetical protein
MLPRFDGWASGRSGMIAMMPRCVPLENGILAGR